MVLWNGGQLTIKYMGKNDKSLMTLPATMGSDEEKLAKFRKVRDQIEQRILTWLQDLPRFDSYWQKCSLKTTLPSGGGEAGA